MAKKYLVIAHCDNPNCKVTEFQLLRRKMSYTTTDDHERIISRVVCPDCRQLGHVDKISSVDTKKEVA